MKYKYSLYRDYIIVKHIKNKIDLHINKLMMDKRFISLLPRLQVLVKNNIKTKYTIYEKEQKNLNESNKKIQSIPWGDFDHLIHSIMKELNYMGTQNDIETITDKIEDLLLDEQILMDKKKLIVVDKKISPKNTLNKSITYKPPMKSGSAQIKQSYGKERLFVNFKKQSMIINDRFNINMYKCIIYVPHYSSYEYPMDLFSMLMISEPIYSTNNMLMNDNVKMWYCLSIPIMTDPLFNELVNFMYRFVKIADEEQYRNMYQIWSSTANISENEFIDTIRMEYQLPFVSPNKFDALEYYDIAIPFSTGYCDGQFITDLKTNVIESVADLQIDVEKPDLVVEKSTDEKSTDELKQDLVIEKSADELTSTVEVKSTMNYSITPNKTKSVIADMNTIKAYLVLVNSKVFGVINQIKFYNKENPNACSLSRLRNVREKEYNGDGSFYYLSFTTYISLYDNSIDSKINCINLFDTKVNIFDNLLERIGFTREPCVLFYMNIKIINDKLPMYATMKMTYNTAKPILIEDIKKYYSRIAMRGFAVINALPTSNTSIDFYIIKAHNKSFDNQKEWVEYVKNGLSQKDKSISKYISRSELLNECVDIVIYKKELIGTEKDAWKKPDGKTQPYKSKSTETLPEIPNPVKKANIDRRKNMRIHNQRVQSARDKAIDRERKSANK